LLNALLDLVPPPDAPVNTGSVDEWRSVTADLMQDLPNELFLLNSAYGSGHFVQDDFWIEIHSVFRPAFAMMVDFNRRVFAQESTRYPDPYSNMFELGAYGFGDEPGAMGRLFWDTSGQMENWMIGLSRPLQRHPISLVGFLTRCFSNQMHPIGFPQKFTSVRFVPWNRPSLIV
jgi:hypothetical protein